MNKRLFSLLAVSALCGLVCGCAKVDVEQERTQAAVIFDIGFSLDGETKAQSAAETNVNRLQVGLYNAAGQLEWENTYEYAFTTMKTITGLTEGAKTIVAVANKAVTMPDSLDEFYDIPVSLGENKRDAFVMVGSEAAEASVDPKITTIHLKRLVSKIRFFNPLLVKWDDGKTHEFIPEKVYIANAATKTNLKGEFFDEFVNPREDTEQTKDETLRDFTVAMREYWVSGDAFNHGVNFYVYPNCSSDRKTTLIIQARYDGQVCYYPLVISDEMLSNTMYSCGIIKITCGGMPSPADDFSSIRVTYNYDNEDWADGPTADSVKFE